MAKTTVNLTDTVTNWVTKTNDLSNTIGDLANLNTTVDSDVVGAINELKTKTDLLDSEDITLSARSAIQVLDGGGDGNLAYDSATGSLTYTGPSASEVRAHITANKGVSISSGEINIDSANVRTLFSVEDSGGSGSLTYSAATGKFVYKGPGATALPAVISSSGTNTFTPPASDDQYVRVNTTAGDITLNVAVGSLKIGQTVVVDLITGGNNLTINWNQSGTSQGISLGNSVELAVGFYNGTAFSFVETVKS